MKRILAVALGIGLLATAGWAEETKPTRTLTVTGTAELNVAPDICYMSFTVETRNRSAVKAYNENNEVMNKVNAAIKAEGIAAKDLSTSQFSITQEYHYDEETNKQVFDGYLVSHTLNVKVRELEKVSKVLDAAVNAGVTTVASIWFTVENPKKYNVQLREEAFKAAKTKAEQMASLGGVKLGKPISISEAEPGNYYHYYAQANVAMSRMPEAASSEPSIEPGEFKISHTVYITYEVE